jgi:Sigma-70, region 4
VNAEEIVGMLLEADGPLHICALIDEASVHLPRRGTRWVAAFTDENGRQVWKSTGQRDRTAAQAIADELEAAAKRKRLAQGGPPNRPVIRVQRGSGERGLGPFTQAETAAIMRISERSVRQLQKSAFTKLRNHPALKEFWREWQTGGLKEAVVPTSTGWVLSAAEIEALLSLARTPIEKHAVRKLIALTGAS